MTLKWVSPATMDDVELIEKQFFSVVASTSLATDQARPPTAIRYDRPKHYVALKFDKTDLPRFNGQESSYLTFRRASRKVLTVKMSMMIRNVFSLRHPTFYQMTRYEAQSLI